MRQFAENITMHGIFRILSSKHLLVKIFWLILFLVSSGYLIYQVVEIFKSFLHYSVTTKIETKIEKPLQFPAVTFCPAKAFEENFTREAVLNDTKLNDILKETDKGKSFVRSFSFGFMPYNYEDHFKRIIIPQMGSCYIFNPNGAVYQKRAGKLYGLSIKLLVDKSAMIPSQGVYVTVHSYDEFPFPTLNGIGLSPGFSSIISLKKRTIRRQPSPYPSDCTYGGEEKLFYPGKYTVNNCELSCTEAEAIKRCGLPISAMTPVYLSNETKTMLLKHSNVSSAKKCLFQPGMVNSLLEIECYCRLPCQEIHYEKSLSFVKWPNGHVLHQYAKQILRANISDNNAEKSLRNRLFELHIYFEEMSNEVITELPEWTLTKLLSDIGGQMGIWLGASVFSVIELLVVVGHTPFNLLYVKKPADDYVIK